MLTPVQALASGGLGPRPTGCFVYVAFDADYNPLYIGQTGTSLRRRLEEQHIPTKAGRTWWPLTVRFNFWSCPSPAAACKLEAHLIAASRPPFNKIGV